MDRTYYVHVSGVGAGNPSTGYSDYASLGNYTISGTLANDGAPPDVATTVATLRGSASAGTTSVKVDGVESWDAASGTWSRDVAVSPGSTTVDVEASNGVSTKTSQIQIQP